MRNIFDALEDALTTPGMDRLLVAFFSMIVAFACAALALAVLPASPPSRPTSAPTTSCGPCPFAASPIPSAEVAGTGGKAL